MVAAAVALRASPAMADCMSTIMTVAIPIVGVFLSIAKSGAIVVGGGIVIVVSSATVPVFSATPALALACVTLNASETQLREGL